ncbi:hypothetical protein U3A58_12935 [Algoriphagus sp. C2-6-M1]|uniref:hypothetical protein n=1 Tax=Algoriphagus persicinus TaxID=3108754 RepID=UPI002B394845|nr:hypothetical protein [Algoriphagus sp. C2-6-M1]MEB2781299.1 hypothetical protein [Algoriphagus sp. C2-6-M1]
MKRGTFILSALALFPLSVFAKIKTNIFLRTEKGKMIVSYLPVVKIEAFFMVTDKWTSPPTKEQIAKVFADHDMKVVAHP